MRAQREDGYDDLLDALVDGDGYYYACPAGHGSLPPQQVCPTCGDDELTTEPLADTGTVVTFTEIAVPSPSFSGQTPVVVIADFGPVRLTGRFVDDSDRLEVGSAVAPTVASSPDGDRHVGVRLASER
jgi:uncharacterized OB-fold protein